MKIQVKLLLILLGIVFAVLLGYILFKDYYADFALLFNAEADRTRLMENIRNHKLKDALLLILLTAVMCAIPGVPNSVIGILIGVSYGPWLGAAMNVTGNVLGNAMGISLLHVFGLSKNTKDHGRIINDISHMKHPAVGVTIGYMVPIIPTFLVNITAVKLNLRAFQLFLAISMGVLPTSFLYAFGGDALFQGNHQRAVLTIASVAVLFLLIGLIRKERANHK